MISRTVSAEYEIICVSRILLVFVYFKIMHFSIKRNYFLIRVRHTTVGSLATVVLSAI